ncbi:NADP-dependent oxidoreductase [Alicyclobacillus sp. SO9]|uniref:NADP-dependent oxidoreductase n=1 Tax=Alicyclobacillus sp. SO9 TaxID=2665646 RepID=UPI0018E8D9E7|nr:NADP-dependent oxidoreductase [Alicyclobacillus sp. SO9]QQE78271.1 NADP-dependent oxidoreductase [Alicyclobacillus sp. SO9]
MKAVYIEEYGSADVLQTGLLEPPETGDKDVLIEAHAASVNPVDWKIREGYLRQFLKYDFPLILGWDVAGVVAHVGSGVRNFKVGDRVFSRPATERNGTYAEYVAVDEHLVASMPSNLSFQEAASIPLAGLTAWEAIVEIAHVEAGQQVLVHAGAGGVGVYAIQLAKALGAYVATTASSRNREFVRSLGADKVIAYDEQNFWEVVKDYDMVLDTLGNDVLEQSIGVLREEGIVVSIAGQPDEQQLKQNNVRGHYFFLQPDGTKLARLGAMFEEGKMKPVVGKVFPLDDVKSAHELSQTLHSRGKIVLSIKD